MQNLNFKFCIFVKFKFLTETETETVNSKLNNYEHQTYRNRQNRQ